MQVQKELAARDLLILLYISTREAAAAVFFTTAQDHLRDWDSLRVLKRPADRDTGPAEGLLILLTLFFTILVGMARVVWSISNGDNNIRKKK